MKGMAMFSSVSLYVSDKDLITAMLHKLETIKSPKPLKYRQLPSPWSLKKQQNTHLKNLPTRCSLAIERASDAESCSPSTGSLMVLTFSTLA